MFARGSTTSGLAASTAETKLKEDTRVLLYE
jgi:hypothetical protein